MQIKHALEMIGETGGTSDWHDNAALDQANRDYEFYSAKVGLLKERLRRVEIISPRVEVDRVELGNRVEVYFVNRRRTKTFTILGQADTGNKPNWISFKSPLGKKLIKRKVGDTVRLKISGKNLYFNVVSILPGDF